MSKIKSITIRLPQDSAAYEIIREKVSEGESWSGACIELLEKNSAEKGAVKLAERQSVHLKKAHEEVTSLRAQLTDLTQDAEEIDKTLEASEMMSESWRKLCVALMQFITKGKGGGS